MQGNNGLVEILALFGPGNPENVVSKECDFSFNGGVKELR
jgi:hypothetical protein